MTRVPIQRESSGLAAAVQRRSMHPVIPWRPAGDDAKHRRANRHANSPTACGRPGPLELAPATLGRCASCYPPAG